MEDHFHSITGIALVTTIALLCGLGLERFRQPAIVGYIVAGIVLGPTGFGFIANTGNIEILAELGVLMLLFIIGMELELKSFMSVIRTSVLCTAAQVFASLVFCFIIGTIVGWSGQKILLFGFILSLSSTAVAIKLLEVTNNHQNKIGRTTVGVLIAQDLALIPMLVLISSFSKGGFSFTAVSFKIAIAVGVITALIYFLNRDQKIVLPTEKWIKGKPELVSLAALGFCFTLATISGLIGLSAAYGAFLAGLVIGNSTDREKVIKVIHPIQSVLLVVFFLSIGLMIDLKYIFGNLFTVLIFLLMAISIKTIFNIGALRLLGEKWESAFPAGLVMAQLGEFSFILASLGVSTQIIDEDGRRLAVSVIALSLLLSPLWLITVRRFHTIAKDFAKGGITNIRLVIYRIYQHEILAMNKCYQHMKAKCLKNKGNSKKETEI